MAKKWIQAAIKKPGALRAKLKVKKGENIPASKLTKKAASLRKKTAAGKKLTPGERRTSKQIALAKTLRKIGRRR